MPAFVIAALAALESLLSATVADGMARTRHNPNAELAAIGVANILSGFACGIPATGAIARTATNIKAGAQTVFTSSMHAVFIMLYVLALAPLISYIPMASLAALLVMTAYNMSHWRQFLRILTIAPREDILVVLVCFGLTVFVDMVVGVSVGITLAALLFVRHMLAVTESHIYEGNNGPYGALPANVMVYSIRGPLFFATVERAINRNHFLHPPINTLILDLEDVPLVDMTGLVALKQLLISDAMAGKRIILCASADVLARLMLKLEGITGLDIHTAEDVSAAIKKAA
jgi:SulP family sulfate permease